MRLNKRLLGVCAGLALLAGALTGCAVADPDTSQSVLHYSGGAFSSQTFEDCIEPGVRAVDGAGDYHYYYPHGRRTFDFTGNPGSDSEPLKVSTKNPNGTATEVEVRGILTLSLVTDCTPWDDADGHHWAGGKFQAFHDNIGRQHQAFATNGGDPMPDAWRESILRPYVGGPIEKALDNVGPAHDWNTLALSAIERNKLQDEAFAQLKGDSKANPPIPSLLVQAIGGPFWEVHTLQIVSVDPPQQLKDAQNNAQVADISKGASLTDSEAAKALGMTLTEYTDYLYKKSVIKLFDQGRGIPVPVGTNVTIPVPTGR